MEKTAIGKHNAIEIPFVRYGDRREGIKPLHRA